MKTEQKAIIIGAGPAGLTAAYELLKNTEIKPIIYESYSCVGGLSKTINYKGNRIDIGGHRFFSKSDRIMNWWLDILPAQGPSKKNRLEHEISYRNQKRKLQLSEIGPDPDIVDNVMLIRPRLSRIYYLRRFFEYPITLNISTIRNLGLLRVISIGIGYIWIRLFPIKEEISLEDFFINRFGKKLYQTFFKDYTEKVWGVPCDKITAEWGAQRIKNLSISKAISHSIKSFFRKQTSIEQKKIETSLIEQFMYPKYGPGQLWEVVADKIQSKGGEIYLNSIVEQIDVVDKIASGVMIYDSISGTRKTVQADYIFSSMPLKELIAGMTNNVPDKIREIAQGLIYRDFITVGILCKKLKIENKTKIKTANNIIPDNWIYIQERDVKVGRLQIFNNWSPYMVANQNTVWLGMEYFCQEGDELWNKSDKEFIEFAICELVKIEIIMNEDVLDSTIIRMPKTYPAYFGTYDRIHELKEFTNNIENLFLIGRNGMHRYNNQDHSMLTSMQAVENIINGITTKNNIWEVNAEEDYHEEDIVVK